jgi:F0F1-type ATP synthase membrane subunit b/b'
MNIEILLYIAAFLAAILGLVLAFITLSYRSLIQKYFALRKENEEMVASAKQKSDEIIKDAQDKAQKIIHESEMISVDTKKILDEKLQSATVQQITEFTGFLEKAQSDMNNVLGNLSKDITTESIREIENFKKSLESQTLKAEDMLKNVIADSNKKLDSEMAIIKEKRINELDSQIFEIIRKVSKEVIAKSINTKDHEDLILEALNEAKTQGLIS